MTRQAAVAGIGLSDLGKVFGVSAPELAAAAVRGAVSDAGLELGDLDGLIVSHGIGTPVGLDLATSLGLQDLRLLTSMQGYGSTAIQMVQYAAMAIMTGTARTVAVVWADDPLRAGESSGGAYATGSAAGWRGLMAANGLTSVTAWYALAARRHMEAYGTTSEDLAAVAIAQREWAGLNPLAQHRAPLTPDDYFDSRWIADPLRLYDCCLVSNGAAALIITSSERADDLRGSAVDILGWGQAHPGGRPAMSEGFGLETGARASGQHALRMADTTLDEIDLLQIYDCYTYTALVTVEDYGFCEKGEGGAFLSEKGRLGPGGSLAMNTGGGQLSSYYLWGMTPLSEAVLQLRGQAGERQLAGRKRALVSGNGGVLDHHATLVLGAP